MEAMTTTEPLAKIGKKYRATADVKRRAVRSDTPTEKVLGVEAGADVALFARVPGFLRSELDAIARKRNVSRNALVIALLADGVLAHKTSAKVSAKSVKGKR